MDMFMDKLAQRQTAHEIIKANTEADTKELNKFKNQVAGYNECLVKLQRLIDEGFVKLANIRTDKEDTARIVEESIGRNMNLQQLQNQLNSVSGMLQEISNKSAVSNAKEGGMTQEMLLQVDTILRELLGDMARAMQEQLGSINQRVQEELGNMGRAMQEQLERMGDIIQLQLKGMDKSVREQVNGMEIAMQEQVNGMGIAIQEQLGSVGKSVQEQCGNMGRSIQEELESMGGIMEKRLNAMDQSMQEQFAGMNKSMEGQLGNVEKSINQSLAEQLGNMEKSINQSIAGQVSNVDKSVSQSITGQLDKLEKTTNQSIEGQFENLAKMLEEKYNRPEGGNTEQLSENMHKECVKVYRNVQAVMVEESGKQSELLDEAKAGIVSLKGKLGIILGISVAALVCSLAGTAFQILTSMNLIP